MGQAYYINQLTTNIGKPLIYRRPCLGYVVVGNDPRTHLYVNMKKRACEEVGFEHIGKPNVTRSKFRCCIA